MGAPVPDLVATHEGAIALVRTWVPGLTLYEHLLADEPPNQSAAEAVREAWRQLTNALTPWDARIQPARRRAARRKRRMEVGAVAQAVADCFPTIPAEAIHDLRETVATADPAVLPLDASPSNIILDGDLVTFIDMELLGLDFADWTYGKYVMAIDAAGAVRSLATSHPDEPAPGIDAAVTLLALARAAGLWDAPRIEPEALSGLLPGRSLASRRVLQCLGLESSVTSDSG